MPTMLVEVGPYFEGPMYCWSLTKTLYLSYSVVEANVCKGDSVHIHGIRPYRADQR